MAEPSADDPKTYKSTMYLLDAKARQEAYKAEVDSLIENKVYTINNRPTDKQPVTSKWVFKKKRGISGVVEKYKARLVAQDFTQEEGVDYTETFSPTIRPLLLGRSLDAAWPSVCPACSLGIHSEWRSCLPLGHEQGCHR